jgi:hypothetical protein
MDAQGLRGLLLEETDVAECRRLGGHPDLVFFRAERCSGLDDASGLSGCTKLRSFLLIDCTPIQSVRFLESCPSLATVGLAGTTVRDGDTSFLNEAGFDIWQR